jgi:Flp pilus assembly protein TadG
VSHFRARPARTDGGSSSLELAILGPAVILLTFISVQFALWYHAKNVAQSAVEAGARESRAFQGTDADGKRIAEERFALLGGPKVTEGGVRVTPGRSATAVTMDLQTRSVALIPGMTLPVHVTAGGPIEKFVGPGP